MGWFNPTDQSSPLRPGPASSPRKARVFTRFRGDQVIYLLLKVIWIYLVGILYPLWDPDPLLGSWLWYHPYQVIRWTLVTCYIWIYLVGMIETKTFLIIWKYWVWIVFGLILFDMLSYQEGFSIGDAASVLSTEFSTQKTARGGIAIVGIYIKDQVTFSHSKRSFVFCQQPTVFRFNHIFIHRSAATPMK